MSTAALWRYGTRFTERYSETLQRAFFGIILIYSLKHYILQSTRSVCTGERFYSYHCTFIRQCWPTSANKKLVQRIVLEMVTWYRIFYETFVTSYYRIFRETFTQRLYRIFHENFAKFQNVVIGVILRIKSYNDTYSIINHYTTNKC
jgi:hypothetical protein